MIDTEVLIRGMRLSGDRTLEFFTMFARSEYALIAAGFRRERQGTVEADWGAVAACLEQRDRKEIQSLLDAGARLADEPPKKLTLVDGSPRFREVHRSGQSDVRWLIESVKRARNNLFHGGKFLTGPEPVARNAFVIDEAITVLRALIELPVLHRVLQAYDELPR